MARTKALITGIALALAGIAPAAAEFPEKPIQVIVPAGPGSATDTITRLVLNKIAEQKTLGQPTVVVNVNGGPIAASRVKDATADGHEIMVYHIGLLSTKAVGKLAFGAEAFEPIAQTGSTQFLVAVAEGGPYKDLKSLVDAAKAKPNTITEGNCDRRRKSHRHPARWHRRQATRRASCRSETDQNACNRYSAVTPPTRWCRPRNTRASRDQVSAPSP